MDTSDGVLGVPIVMGQVKQQVEQHNSHSLLKVLGIHIYSQQRYCVLVHVPLKVEVNYMITLLKIRFN